MSKQTELETLKIEFPILTRFDGGVEIELQNAEYDEQIEAIWEIRKEAKTKKQFEQEQALAKIALLDRLGITEDEAKLLLS